MNRKACPFCGSTTNKKSDEHVWPDWLRGLLPGKRKTHKPVRHRFETTLGPGRVYSTIPFTQTVGGICERDCNNGWMSDMEKYAKPLLAPMILASRRVTLDATDMKTIANWITMKAMVFHWMMKRDLIGVSQYRYLTHHLRPPPTAQLWIAANTGEETAYSIFGLKGSVIGTSETEVRSPSDLRERFYLYLATIVVGHFVGEVFAHNLPFDFTLTREGLYAPTLEPIWPPGDVMEWPPKQVIRSVEHFAKDRTFDESLTRALEGRGYAVKRMDI
jgi:hypothetical protein